MLNRKAGIVNETLSIIRVGGTIFLKVVSMTNIQEIIPITGFREDALGIVERVRDSHDPILITQEGEAAAVLLNVKDYERREHERQILMLLVRGEKEIAGIGYDLDDVMADADDLIKHSETQN